MVERPGSTDEWGHLLLGLLERAGWTVTRRTTIGDGVLLIATGYGTRSAPPGTRSPRPPRPCSSESWRSAAGSGSLELGRRLPGAARALIEDVCTPRQIDALKLRAAGMSARGIARVLDVDEARVRGLLERAYRRIRDRTDDLGTLRQP